MSTFLDYDPLTGVSQDLDATYGDNKLQIHYKQDVEPVIELAKIERINGLCDTAAQKKADVPRLFARIPPTVILKLRHEYGLNIFSNDKTERTRAFQTIEREFPHLKTTEMKLYGGRRKA